MPFAEEPWLRERLGPRFEDYAADAPRFLPAMERRALRDDQSEPPRPVVLTVLCTVSLLALTIALTGKLFPSVRVAPGTVASVFELPIEFLFPIGILATIGIWLMRRWGLFLYGAFTIIGYGVNLALGIRPGFVAPAFSIAFFAVALHYRRQMR